MNENFESVYPDFLRAGMMRLSEMSERRELLSLFTALEHFRRDLHAQDTVEGILRVSRRYIDGLNLFSVAGFYLVNPDDLSFEIALCSPELDRKKFEAAVQVEIKAGRFGRALRQNCPVFFRDEFSSNRGMLHSLSLSSQVLGMFAGLLREEIAPAQEIAFRLLSLLLGESADALATLHKTAQLKSQINTLSGLLPICSWCKKVRDDRGYWEQIEQFIHTRSDASFSHGICPQCAQDMIRGLRRNGTPVETATR